MRNIFLENGWQNFVEKQVLDYFLKNQNCSYHWINNLNFIQLFYRMSNHLFLPHIKKTKKRSRTSLLHNFWRKKFLTLYSINSPNFIVWLPLLLDLFDNMCIRIVLELFVTWPKKSGKFFKYFKNEKRF